MDFKTREWNISKLDERFDIIFKYISNIWKRPDTEESVVNIEDIIFYCKGPRSYAIGRKKEKNL